MSLVNGEFIIFGWFTINVLCSLANPVSVANRYLMWFSLDHLSMSTSQPNKGEFRVSTKGLMAKTTFFDVLLGFFCPLVHREIAQFYPEKITKRFSDIFRVHFFAPIPKFFCVSFSTQQKEASSFQFLWVHRKISKSHSCDSMKQTTHFFIDLWSLVECVWSFSGISSSRISSFCQRSRCYTTLLMIVEWKNRKLFDIFMLDNESTAIKCMKVQLTRQLIFLLPSASCVALACVECLSRWNGKYITAEVQEASNATRTWHIISWQKKMSKNDCTNDTRVIKLSNCVLSINGTRKSDH